MSFIKLVCCKSNISPTFFVWKFIFAYFLFKKSHILWTLRSSQSLFKNFFSAVFCFYSCFFSQACYLLHLNFMYSPNSYAAHSTRLLVRRAQSQLGHMLTLKRLPPQNPQHLPPPKSTMMEITLRCQWNPQPQHHLQGTIQGSLSLFYLYAYQIRNWITI